MYSNYIVRSKQKYKDNISASRVTFKWTLCYKILLIYVPFECTIRPVRATDHHVEVIKMYLT